MTPDPPPPVLELRDVRKSYGDLEVLHGIDLTVEAGEFAVIVGPSGSGKSTLTHLMGTLDRPTSGSVLVTGRDIAGLSDAELAAVRAYQIGFVFQQFFLAEAVTALDNVAHGLLYRGTPIAERRSRAEEELIRVGLEHRLHHRAAALSGGERQRVAIARALIGRPVIIFADEPTGNLDTRNGEDILRLLKDLNAEGTTITLITHDLAVAEQGSRQLEIRDGLIVSDTRRPKPVHPA
jgi:putative ABC transport system ATP-binding protein